MKKYLLLLLACLMALAGCNKKEPPVFSGLEAGTLAGGVFTSDSGTKMTVIDAEKDVDIATSRRVLISYETQSLSDSDHIEIKLLNLWDADIVVPRSVQTLEEKPEGAPVQVTDAWFSARYLNILASYEGKDPAKHLQTAFYRVDDKNMVIRLLHDSEETIEANSNSQLNVFISIPMDEPVLSFEQYALSIGKKEVTYPAPVLLQWTARVVNGGPLTLYEREGSYSPPASN